MRTARPCISGATGATGAIAATAALNATAIIACAINVNAAMRFDSYALVQVSINYCHGRAEIGF